MSGVFWCGAVGTVVLVRPANLDQATLLKLLLVSAEEEHEMCFLSQSVAST